MRRQQHARPSGCRATGRRPSGARSCARSLARALRWRPRAAPGVRAGRLGRRSQRGIVGREGARLADVGVHGHAASPPAGSRGRGRDGYGEARGVSPSGPGGSTRGGRKRTKCRPAGARARASGPPRALAGRSPGNTAASSRPLKILPSMRSPGSARRRCRGGARRRPWPPPRASPAARRAPARRPRRRRRPRAPMARSVMRRRIASSRSWLEEWMWSALVAANRSLSMRRPPKSAVSQVLEPVRNTAQHGIECALQVGDGLAAVVQGAEHVDEHDLAVEPAEMIAEERPHDVRLIALEAARHHGGERAARARALRIEGSGQKVSKRRAFEIARHQEAPGTRACAARGRRRAPPSGSRQRGCAPFERRLLVLARRRDRDRRRRRATPSRAPPRARRAPAPRRSADHSS